MRVRLVLVPVLGVLLGVASLLAAGRMMLGPRQTGRSAAPDFSVSRFSDGRSVSLSDLRGKVVLLYFFFPT
jgi:cytochrome oxidase Cu insertion factor (SCO1/SenC/PrrC family)